MDTIKLKNSEIAELQVEIDMISKELSSQKAFLPKYHLSNLVSSMDSYFKNLENSRIELVKTYGETKESGEITIEQFTDEEKTVLSDKYKSFIDDFTNVLNTEIEVSYNPLPLSVFEKVETEKFYPVLYKFIK
jgi:hypothetical protein